MSITKFSIVIGSPRAYLTLNGLAITWVSNYVYSIFFKLYSHIICASIRHCLMPFFTLFSTIYKTYKNRYGSFRSIIIIKVIVIGPSGVQFRVGLYTNIRIFFEIFRSFRDIKKILGKFPAFLPIFSTEYSVLSVQRFPPRYFASCCKLLYLHDTREDNLSHTFQLPLENL